jgi:hypothetical protein
MGRWGEKFLPMPNAQCPMPNAQLTNKALKYIK